MAEDIKFTEDEMTSLKQLQEDYTTKQEQLGQISVQRILLNQQIDSLQQRQEQLEKESNKAVNALSCLFAIASPNNLPRSAITFEVE